MQMSNSFLIKEHNKRLHANTQVKTIGKGSDLQGNHL